VHVVGQKTLSLVTECSSLVQCARCKLFWSPVHFHSNSPISKHPYCKVCRCEAEKLRRLDPEWQRLRRIKHATDLRWRAREMHRALKKRSKRDGLEFDLTAEWIFEKFRAGTCDICDLPFDFSSTEQAGPYTPSVDRIIAGGGYTRRNCRVVLMCVNAAMMAWGMEAFLPVAKAIAAKY
jgi:hypothetical protein